MGGGKRENGGKHAKCGGKLVKFLTFIEKYHKYYRKMKSIFFLDGAGKAKIMWVVNFKDLKVFEILTGGYF